MKSITRLVTAVMAVMFAVGTLCPAQDVKPTDLGKVAAFHGKKIEMRTRERSLTSCLSRRGRVRRHHGRPKQYRRAPFRLRLLRRGSR
jgi:hypothetical protein